MMPSDSCLVHGKRPSWSSTEGLLRLPWRLAFWLSIGLDVFLYNRGRNHVISHIYREDKYGMVIVYAVVTYVFSCMDHQRLQSLQGTNSYTDTLLTMLSAAKLLFFALTFKHHTGNPSS